MGFIADVQRALENRRAGKDNERRGREEFKRREVEALEAIAKAVTKGERS